MLSLAEPITRLAYKTVPPPSFFFRRQAISRSGQDVAASRLLCSFAPFLVVPGSRRHAWLLPETYGLYCVASTSRGLFQLQLKLPLNAVLTCNHLIIAPYLCVSTECTFVVVTDAEHEAFPIIRLLVHKHRGQIFLP